MWFMVEMMFEVIVWLKLNGLLMVMMKLLICSWLLLLSLMLVRFCVGMWIRVMLVLWFEFRNWVLIVCLLVSVICMLLVFLIIWWLVSIRFFLVLMIMLELSDLLMCFCGMFGNRWWKNGLLKKGLCM